MLEGSALVRATILAMAVGTLLTRIGGFWIMRFFPEGGFIARAFHHLPGALVVAILAPMALQIISEEREYGPLVAILAAVVIARFGGHALLAVFGAVAVVALLRLAL